MGENKYYFIIFFFHCVFVLLSVLERLGIELRPPEIPPAVTPQQLLQKSIEQQVQQVKTSTGIELPKYYNPAAMNPARYAEQMQKRKLLWGNKVRTWLSLVVSIRTLWTSWCALAATLLCHSYGLGTVNENIFYFFFIILNAAKFLYIVAL